jgi:hypothetical protein
MSETSQQLTANPAPDGVKSVSLELVESPLRRNPWRPTTLTIRKFLRICHLVEKGFATSRACEVECISYSRFRFRVQRSRRLHERLKEAEDVRFQLRHDQALASIMAAGERSWMAHAWFLERSAPQLWALKTVQRPELEKESGAEPELPAEVLKRHRDLFLQLAREDAEKQALGNSEG